MHYYNDLSSFFLLRKQVLRYRVRIRIQYRSDNIHLYFTLLWAGPHGSFLLYTAAGTLIRPDRIRSDWTTTDRTGSDQTRSDPIQSDLIQSDKIISEQIISDRINGIGPDRIRTGRLHLHTHTFKHTEGRDGTAFRRYLTICAISPPHVGLSL